MNMTSTDFANTFVAKSVLDAYKIKDQRRTEYLHQIVHNNPEKLLNATATQKLKTRNALDDLKDQILGRSLTDLRVKNDLRAYKASKKAVHERTEEVDSVAQTFDW